MGICKTNTLIGSRPGLTLVEVTVAIVVVGVAAVGLSSFRYHAALDARKADVHIVAGRAALLLCEGWRGTAGDTSYDPVTDLSSVITISASGSGPAAPGSFAELGKYEIISEGVKYYATLSWQDVVAGLRSLSVVIGWDQRGNGAGFANVDKEISLVTYSRY